MSCKIVETYIHARNGQHFFIKLKGEIDNLSSGISAYQLAAQILQKI